jgi:hypothetical protein
VTDVIKEAANLTRLAIPQISKWTTLQVTTIATNLIKEGDMRVELEFRKRKFHLWDGDEPGVNCRNMSTAV